MRNIFILFFIVCISVQCKQQSSIYQQPQVQTGLITEKAMVVSARQEASEIGVAIMKKGGNAFDAMIATDLALVVAYPFSGNIGGGGFTVYRTKE
ncbi:MAG: gamma-glutamyltransferase, partial [Flavobacteriaceae bacterium]|nr:gamma-glutamyltransferase [Flavobacteriaceae bacterium]